MIKSENSTNLEGQINDTNRNIQVLNAEAKDFEAENQKLRGDSLQFQKAYENEVSKNFDQNSKLTNQESSSKGKELQLSDLKIELEVLNRAYSAATNSYGNLREEIDQVNLQIRFMEQNNEEVLNSFKVISIVIFSMQLVHELEKFSHQDQQLIEILNRKSKVEELKAKAGSRLTQTVNTIDRVKSSPTRRSTTDKYNTTTAYY